MIHPFLFQHWSSYTHKRDHGASCRLLATLAQVRGLLVGIGPSPAASARPWGADAARTESKNGDVPELCQSSCAQVGLVLGGRARRAGLGLWRSLLATSNPAPSQGTPRHAGGTSHPVLLGIISERQGKRKLFLSTLYF